MNEKQRCKGCLIASCRKPEIGIEAKNGSAHQNRTDVDYQEKSHIGTGNNLQPADEGVCVVSCFYQQPYSQNQLHENCNEQDIFDERVAVYGSQTFHPVDMRLGTFKGCQVVEHVQGDEKKQKCSCQKVQPADAMSDCIRHS